MTASYRRRRVDLSLRAAGALLCGIAYVAITHLAAMPVRAQSATAVAYGFASVGFLGASAGSAMIVLGHHLFDEIEVSQRWRQRRHPTTRSSSHPASGTVMDRSDIEMPVVGMDADGNWTVRGNEGRLLGGFATGQAARQYGRNQRQRPAVPTAGSPDHPGGMEGRVTVSRDMAPRR